MRNDIGIKKQVLSMFLMAIFTAYTINITFFVHTHIVNGQTITHSHFYCGTPDNPEHGHSSAQFQTIKLLSYLLASSIMAIFFACFLQEKKFIGNSPFNGFRNVDELFSFSLRAPPIR
ncbi:MAG: hypothetical protein LBG92_08975 [Prevotellaceae bacterium]|jgi:hypothetical protein|nr:hypothetical protein [Prevotellaceae bacterium]